MSISDQKELSICITTGGTGGHVMPAIGLLTYLQNNYPYKSCSLCTDRRGSKLIDFDNLPKDNFLLAITNSHSKSFPMRIMKILWNVLGCLWFMRKYDVLVSFGTYNSVPYLIAAVILRKKIILHEQNATLSRVNRLFHRFSKYVALTFPIENLNPKIKRKVTLTGTVLREKIYQQWDQYNCAPSSVAVGDGDVSTSAGTNTSNTNSSHAPVGKFTIFFLFGSLGAAHLGNWIIKLINNLPNQYLENIELMMEENLINIREIEDKPVKITLYKKNFDGSIGEYYRKSNLIICRAGAVSLYEALVFKRKMLMLPLKNSIGDHQLINAQFIESLSMGQIIEEKFEGIPLVVGKILNYYVEFYNNPTGSQQNFLYERNIIGNEGKLITQLIHQ